ncbi:MAG: AraC family transcriptional regulator, partial [Clostridia bacterium]|nr:AraC family transcriptional regulator [Clostridia bacterium]
MYDLGLNIENFNPHIYYTLKGKYDDTYITGYHCHDYVSMIYILSGNCTYKISNTLYQVKKGDMLIFNPGVYHSKAMRPGEEILEFQAGFGNICLEGLPKGCLVESDACPVISLPMYEQDFLKCCSDIFLEQENSEPGSKLLLKINVMKFLILYLKTTHKEQEHSENTHVNFESFDKAVIVNTLISFLNENYMHQISLETISKNFYMSPAYISKVFKEEMGESPINYLIKIRLAKARDLLLEGKMSIKAVARTVGYEDAYHFSKLY